MESPVEPLFAYLSKESGFVIDQIRYMVLMAASFPMALVLCLGLHPDRTSLLVRYVYSIAMGMTLGLLCFGWRQMSILLAIIVISYLLITLIPPQSTQRYSMVWAMGTMTAVHLYRTFTDWGGYTLDFSGPMMVMTQKIMLAAYALHDGQARKDSDLNADQRAQKISKVPGVLEYFGYMFNFHSLLAGPSCTFKEYVAFMDGSNLKPSSYPNGPDGRPRKPPSATYPVLSKLFISLISLCSFLTLSQYIDNSVILEPHHPQPLRLGLNYINSFRIRGRYYFIWFLAESINNCAGLGFAGYDQNGKENWKLVQNINLWDIEFGTSVRSIANGWNAMTSLWLRRCVYERATFAPMLAAFTLSAWWHGFYPGYYLCFIYFAIVMEATRKMRRLVRPYFQGSASLRIGYDVLTWVLAHIYLDYGVLCLDMMWLGDSLTYWSYYYYIPLISALVVALFFPTGRSQRSKPKEGREGTDSKPHENGETIADSPKVPTKDKSD